MQLARILVFTLALTHTVGLVDLVVDDACADGCDDDGCADDCGPGVACRCHCPSTMSFVGATSIVTFHAALEPAPFCPSCERLHDSPDPREILHVPRLVA